MKKQIVSSIRAGFVALLLLAFFSSCSGGTNSIDSEGATGEEESTNFVSESLPFYKLSDTSSDVLQARFYNGERYIPYVSLRYYLKNFDVFTPVKSSYSDGKYTYEYRQNGKSFPITIDVNNDTIYCADWTAFIEETETGDEDYVTKKILNVVKSYSGQNTRTFDLKKYGMEIYGGSDGAYVPLCVLNQLFTARSYKEIFYNGEGVYFFDYNKSFTYANYKKSPWYMSADGLVCERPQKLIDLTYNMLCFAHDYFYGQPGYYGFADDGNGSPDAAKVRSADGMSFDEMLAAYSPDVQTMLKSSSYFEYLKGLTKLLWYTYGDCHTDPLYAGKGNYLPNYPDDKRNEIKDFGTDNKSKKSQKNDERGAELKEARKNASGRTDAGGNPKAFYVLSGGKTAVFTFDSFAIDTANWKAYYDSSHVAEEPNPFDFEGWGLTFPTDPTGIFYTIVNKLLTDSSYSSVETVLIDVSCNGGGDDRCLKKLFAYLIDNADFRKYDVHGDMRYDCYISADLNLDGKIDNEDAEYRQKIKDRFKFVVLSSRASFSCGNAFPTICADEGISVIGERSGGGACIVLLGCTADGFLYRFSSNNRISHKSDWSTVESGAAITTGGEITAAADFYDDAKLQAVIDSVVK